MTTYIESSAFLKLLREEEESEALRHFLSGLPPGELFSSRLLSTEAHRAASRLEGFEQENVLALLDAVDLVHVLDEVCDAAGRLAAGHPVRALDALHLATARLVEAEVMLSYDARQIDAASLIGLPTLSPA